MSFFYLATQRGGKGTSPGEVWGMQFSLADATLGLGCSDRAPPPLAYPLSLEFPARAGLVSQFGGRESSFTEAEQKQLII